MPKIFLWIFFRRRAQVRDVLCYTLVGKDLVQRGSGASSVRFFFFPKRQALLHSTRRQSTVDPCGSTVVDRASITISYYATIQTSRPKLTDCLLFTF